MRTAVCATKEQNKVQANVKDLRLYVQSVTHGFMNKAFQSISVLNDMFTSQCSAFRKLAFLANLFLKNNTQNCDLVQM
jgi:hypothetical protein